MIRHLLFVFISVLLLFSSAARGDAPYPSPQWLWSDGDYVTFYFAHFNGNQALPHLRHSPAREIFLRLVDRRNLAEILEADTPIAVKRQRIAKILSILGEVRAAYNYQVVMGEPLAEELTEVQLFSLDVIALSIALSMSPTGDVRQQPAWTTSFLGFVQSLGERQIYGREQRLALLAALEQHYEIIRPALSERDKSTLNSELQQIAQTETDATLAARFTEWLEAMR
jgi:hypothetical protein